VLLAVCRNAPEAGGCNQFCKPFSCKKRKDVFMNSIKQKIKKFFGALCLIALVAVFSGCNRDERQERTFATLDEAIWFAENGCSDEKYKCNGFSGWRTITPSTGDATPIIWDAITREHIRNWFEAEEARFVPGMNVEEFRNKIIEMAEDEFSASELPLTISSLNAMNNHQI
jgi:hypothetical protein